MTFDWQWRLLQAIPFGVVAAWVVAIGPPRIMIWIGVQMATRGESLISAGLAWARRDREAKLDRAKRSAELKEQLKTIEGRV